MKRIAAAEGGHRTLSPAAALDLAESAMRRHGLRFRRIPLHDYCDLGCYADCYLGLERERRFALGHDLHFGKGTSPEQSRLSGLFECFERVSALFSDDIPRVRATRRDLTGRGDSVLDPFDCPMPAGSCVAAPEYYGTCDPCRFDSGRALDWFPARSLFDGSKTLLPVCMTHSLDAGDIGNLIRHNRPNGLASGSCLEEAVLVGLFELIERDAVCIFALNSLPVPEIRPESIAEPRAQAFLRLAEREGVTVTVRNVTMDLGIPAFCTYLEDPDPSEPALSSGSGAHCSREIALLRSITEACLDRAYYRKHLSEMRSLRVGALPRRLRWEAARNRERLLTRNSGRNAFVHNAAERQLFSAVPTWEFDDLRQAERFVVDRLVAGGLGRAYVADLTRYDVPTVRVCVQDLEFAASAFYRYADTARQNARRLFTVPIRLGYKPHRDFEPLSGTENDAAL